MLSSLNRTRGKERAKVGGTDAGTGNGRRITATKRSKKGACLDPDMKPGRKVIKISPVVGE